MFLRIDLFSRPKRVRNWSGGGELRRMRDQLQLLRDRGFTAGEADMAAFVGKIEDPRVDELLSSRPFGTPQPIRNWTEAFARNFTLATVVEGIFNPTIIHGLSPRGKGLVCGLFLQDELLPISPREKAGIRPFIEFIQREQRARESVETRQGWERITELTGNVVDHYLPRHSDATYVFSPRHQRLFKDRRVLDIGCRVNPGLTPFYRHYRQFGAIARGIDLKLETGEETAEVSKGDARMLPFADKSFDFITLPKIYGWRNPANTVLEVTAGLSELYRVLDNGLVHVADDMISPKVAYIADRIGFRCFLSPAWVGSLKPWNGIPVGLMMVKRDAPLTQNPFETVARQLNKGEISFPRRGQGEETIKIG